MEDLGKLQFHLNYMVDKGFEPEEAKELLMEVYQIGNIDGILEGLMNESLKH